MRYTRALAISSNRTTSSTKHSSKRRLQRVAERHFSLPMRRWHTGMRVARQRRAMGVVYRGTGSSSLMLVDTPHVEHFRGGVHVAVTRFEADKDTINTIGTSVRKRGRERGGATAGEPDQGTSRWGILYADNAGVVLQSSKLHRKVMVVIMTVCTAFRLTVSEAKNEITCMRTKEVSHAIRGTYKQTSSHASGLTSVTKPFYPSRSIIA